jgi:hypothetical protein
MERTKCQRELEVSFDTSFAVSEDYARWNFFAIKGLIGGVTRTVSARYVLSTSLSITNPARIIRNATQIQVSYLKQLGMRLGPLDIDLHEQLTNPALGGQANPDSAVLTYGLELCECLGAVFPESASTIKQIFLIYWIRYLAQRGALAQYRSLLSGRLIEDLLPAVRLYLREKGPFVRP